MMRIRKGNHLLLIVGLAMMLCPIATSWVMAEGTLAEVYSAPFDAPDGTYRGAAIGKEDPVTAEVTIAGGRIVKVAILQHGDTPGIGDAAFELMPDEFVEAQSTKVDAVSGATLSSQGVIDAVRAALASAIASKK